MYYAYAVSGSSTTRDASKEARTTSILNNPIILCRLGYLSPIYRRNLAIIAITVVRINQYIVEGLISIIWKYINIISPTLNIMKIRRR